MRLTFFLDLEEAEFLSRLLPPASLARKAVHYAILAHQYWGSIGRDVYVECDYDQGDELLAYAHLVALTRPKKSEQLFN